MPISVVQTSAKRNLIFQNEDIIIMIMYIIYKGLILNIMNVYECISLIEQL